MGERESRWGFASAELAAGHLGPSSGHKQASPGTRGGVLLWVAASLGAARTRKCAPSRSRRPLSLRQRSDKIRGHSVKSQRRGGWRLRPP